MKYVAAYMLLGVVVCLVIFCAYELNEMRKCAKQYAEAKMRFDAMIWREASELKNKMEGTDETRT